MPGGSWPRFKLAGHGPALLRQVRTKARIHPTSPYCASFALSAAISFTGASAVAGRPRGSTAEM